MRRPATSGRRAAKSSKNRATPVDSERRARAWPPWLDALLEALPDAAVLFDTSDKLIAANRRFLEVYGLSTANAKRLDIRATGISWYRPCAKVRGATLPSSWVGTRAAYLL